MKRRLSTRLGVWIGLIVGFIVAAVGLVHAFVEPEGPAWLNAIIRSATIGLVIPTGAIVGAVVGFLLGERPRKPRDPDEAYPPAG